MLSQYWNFKLGHCTVKNVHIRSHFQNDRKKAADMRACLDIVFLDLGSYPSLLAAFDIQNQSQRVCTYYPYTL